MSRVYFHSPSGEAEVQGAERMMCDQLVRRIAEGILDLGGPWPERRLEHLAPVLAPGNLTGNAQQDARDLLLRFGTSVYSDRPLFAWRGYKIEAWTVQLNTAVALGSDAIRFCARVHGQCEVHGWVDGPNRKWLAGIVRDGLDVGVLRRYRDYEDAGGTVKRYDPGWGHVADFLCERDDEPVVMSYSVTESFPSRVHGPAMPEEEWEDLPDHLRWSIAFAELKKSEPRNLLEMKPETWATYRFGHEVTLLDLTATDREERLDRILEVSA